MRPFLGRCLIQGSAAQNQRWYQILQVRAPRFVSASAIRPVVVGRFVLLWTRTQLLAVVVAPHSVWSIDFASVVCVASPLTIQ